jgi:uncharacterized protein YjbI with pentapeptide repeats
MKHFLRRLLVISLSLGTLVGTQVVAMPAAESASTCEALRQDISRAVDASPSYGSSVPNLCTTDCPALYSYYSNFPNVDYYNSLSSRLVDLWSSCNVSKVPPTGLPSSGTTPTPDRGTIKCPKITKDMRGRKDFAGTTCLAGKVLAGFNLSGMDLTGASLRSTNLANANLTSTKFTRANLTNAVLDYATVQSADFSSASFSDIRASNLSGTPSRLPTSWKLSKGYLFGPHVDLSKVWLKGATLDNLDLSYADLTKTNLDGAKLSNLQLNQAKFTPSLNGTTTRALSGRPFTSSALIVNGYLIAEGVNLTRVNLSYANLRNKTIKDVDLSYANLSGAYLNGAKFVDVTLKNVRLDNAQLDNATFDSCDLSYASIQRVKAQSASFYRAKLQHTDFSYSNLTGASLAYADVYYMRINNTDLTKVRMDGVRANTYVSGTPKALPVGWYLSNNFLKKT